jgi:hypothetical protein
VGVRDKAAAQMQARADALKQMEELARVTAAVKAEVQTQWWH